MRCLRIVIVSFAFLTISVAAASANPTAAHVTKGTKAGESKMITISGSYPQTGTQIAFQVLEQPKYGTLGGEISATCAGISPCTWGTTMAPVCFHHPDRVNCAYGIT